MYLTKNMHLIKRAKTVGGANITSVPRRSQGCKVSTKSEQRNVFLEVSPL